MADEMKKAAKGTIGVLGTLIAIGIGLLLVAFVGFECLAELGRSVPK
jgi:amino acid transporter